MPDSTVNLSSGKIDPNNAKDLKARWKKNEFSDETLIDVFNHYQDGLQELTAYHMFTDDFEELRDKVKWGSKITNLAFHIGVNENTQLVPLLFVSIVYPEGAQNGKPSENLWFYLAPIHKASRHFKPSNAKQLDEPMQKEVVQQTVSSISLLKKVAAFLSPQKEGEAKELAKKVAGQIETLERFKDEVTDESAKDNLSLQDIIDQLEQTLTFLTSVRHFIEGKHFKGFPDLKDQIRALEALTRFGSARISRHVASNLVFSFNQGKSRRVDRGMFKNAGDQLVEHYSFAAVLDYGHKIRPKKDPKEDTEGAKGINTTIQSATNLCFYFGLTLPLPEHNRHNASDWVKKRAGECAGNDMICHDDIRRAQAARHKNTEGTLGNQLFPGLVTYDDWPLLTVVCEVYAQQPSIKKDTHTDGNAPLAADLSTFYDVSLPCPPSCNFLHRL